MDSIHCPACGSASVRTREIVYKSGTSYGSGKGRGGGFSSRLTSPFRPRAFLGGGGWSGKRQSLQAQEAAPTPFWPAVLALFLLVAMPNWGFWAWVGFFFSAAWSIGAAVDRWAFHREWLCSKCGETFSVVRETVVETDTRPGPGPASEPEPPPGEVVTLEATAKRHLTGGKTCSICGEWSPYEEFQYGNRENRSYCQQCNREERAAYAEGGREGARQYRDAMRATWQQSSSGVRG